MIRQHPLLLVCLPVLIIFSGPIQSDILSKREQGKVHDEAVHILGGNTNVIARWTDDIRYAIIGKVSNSAAITARDTFIDIAAQTGLTPKHIRHDYRDAASYLKFVQQSSRNQLSTCFAAPEVQATDCANFIVFLSDVDTMRQLAKAIPLRSVYQQAFRNPADVQCFFAPFNTSGMVIRQAFVYVREDLSTQMQLTCLHEEIYQSFGLFNDYSGSRYFSFNNVVEPKVITPYDRALLKTVYEPRFRPGAPVFAVAKRLMENLGFDPFNKDPEEKNDQAPID